MCINELVELITYGSTFKLKIESKSHLGFSILAYVTIDKLSKAVFMIVDIQSIPIIIYDSSTYSG